MEGPQTRRPSNWFYLHNWNLVGNFVLGTVMGIVTGHLDIEQYNYTDILLVPKGKNQTSRADYRSIGLCNALYKVMSKTISNSLSKVHKTNVPS